MTIHDYPCDVCGAGDAAPIEVTRHYTKGEPIAVCRNCGFVYARWRPSPADIADAWATQVFSGKFEDGAYTARGIPAVRARHVYVAEFIHGRVSLKGQETVDIGAGEGVFLKMLAGPDYGAKPFGVELSGPNCELMTQAGFCPDFKGMVEDYLASPGARMHGFDRATVVWTLENTSSCSSMMSGAHRLLKQGGYLTVATSSRILVPFKKPPPLLPESPGERDPSLFLPRQRPHQSVHQRRLPGRACQPLHRHRLPGDVRQGRAEQRAS